jgi:hypothetical protein
MNPDEGRGQMTTMTDGAKPVKQRARQANSMGGRTGGVARASFASRWAGIKMGTPVLVWTIAIRLATVLVDYLLVLTTALSVIPMLGAYLHQQSGASLGDPTASGAIALWLVPFLFVVVMLAVAQIAFMRWLWRAGSARIASIKRGRLDNQEQKVGKGDR